MLGADGGFFGPSDKNYRQGGGRGRRLTAPAFSILHTAARNVTDIGALRSHTGGDGDHREAFSSTARLIANDEPLELTMIRTLLTTTALAALLATGAIAQDTTTTTTTDPNAPAATSTDAANQSMSTNMSMRQPFDMATGYNSADTDNLATRILGTPVYSSAADGADKIGDVNDLVLGDDGSVRAVIIGVGGFLGVGEKNVAVDFSQMKMVIAADNTERWVVETTKEALEAAPDFQFVEDKPADAAMAPADNTMAPADNTMAPADNNAMAPADNNAMAPADTTAAPADNAMAPADNNAMAPADTTAAPADNAMAPADTTTDANANAMTTTDTAATPMTPIDRTTLGNVDATTLTADDLIGTKVVGPDNEQIAEVGDLVLTQDGKIDAVLIDFGGFLGIGEKRVAVGMDNLDFATDQNGNRYVFVNFTKEQLDAAPAYDEATYATARDSQRVTMQVQK